MTAQPDRWSDPWQRRSNKPPHRLHLVDSAVGRWSAHRMSRRFADVGVCIPATRLREILAGAPSGPDESVDVSFAFAATEIKRGDRLARARRTRRRLAHWLLVAGLVLAALNLLVLMGYAFISLALHETPT